MKNNSRRLISALSIAFLTFGCGALIASNIQKGNQEVAAASSSQYSSTSLPSTIYLNPVEEEEVRSYYSSLAGRNLSGNDLLKALKVILVNGQKYHSYDSGNAIWQMYEITDRDWELSPACGITNGTYHPDTNTITSYTYGSFSNKLDNPYLHLLYRNHDEPASRIHAWDTHGSNNGIDREHVWPKSRGFGKDGNVEMEGPGARGDIHHLMAGDSFVNSSTHSNNAYGFVDIDAITDKKGEDAGQEYKINNKVVVAGNYRGMSLTFGTSLGSNEVFEPQDCDKGDIARACFYMVARYNNLAGDDLIDVGNPNLFLEDTVDTTTIFSTAENPVSLGLLRDLLAWHKLDPVDEYEIHRNDLIHRNYAKNRNPFIDFPEWVDYIWGTVEIDDDRRHITARDETPTGTADPENDIFHGYREPEDNPVEATDIINNAFTGIGSPKSYTNWSGKQGSESTAVYAGNSMGDHSSVQLRSSPTGSGIVSTASGGKVTSISVSWNSNTADDRTISIYGKNTAYSGPADLYSNDANTQGTLLGEIKKGTSTSLTIDGDYDYLGIRSKSGALYLDSISITYNGGSAPTPVEITSITATTSKSFKVGDTITASDITVRGNDNSIIQDFEFDDYQFVYEDAPSGGSSGNKELTVAYGNLHATLSVPLQRDSYVAPNDDSITISGADGHFDDLTTTKSESNVYSVTVDDIVYHGTGIYKYTVDTVKCMSFYSKSDHTDSQTGQKYYISTGAFGNQTKYPTSIKSVSFVDAGSPSTEPVVEYSETGLENNWDTANNGHCHYFRLRCAETYYGYVNISSISVTLYGEETPINLVNYLMYEDTSNQCTQKLDVAIRHFENLTAAGRSSFMTSDLYTFTAARTRLEAWAYSQGKSIVYNNGDYKIQGSDKATPFATQNEMDSTVPMFVIIIAVSLVGTGFYFFLKRKAF